MCERHVYFSDIIGPSPYSYMDREAYIRKACPRSSTQNHRIRLRFPKPDIGNMPCDWSHGRKKKVLPCEHIKHIKVGRYRPSSDESFLNGVSLVGQQWAEIVWCLGEQRISVSHACSYTEHIDHRSSTEAVCFFVTEKEESRNIFKKKISGGY